MTKVKILLKALEDLRAVRQQATEEITSAMLDAAKSQSDVAKENIKSCLRVLQEHEDQTSKLVQALSRI